VTDSKRARAARNALIATARTRYIGWRIDQPAVEQALRDADVPAAQASDLLARWAVERELNVHQLTEAQVLAAYKKALLTRDAALERLLDLGLDAGRRAYPAWRNLSVPDIVKPRGRYYARGCVGVVALGFSATDAGMPRRACPGVPSTAAGRGAGAVSGGNATAAGGGNSETGLDGGDDERARRRAARGLRREPRRGGARGR
jgi:hypothetical protein